MNPRSLRRFANRFGAVSLLLVGAYLVAWHLWTRKRRALAACGILVLMACLGALIAFGPRSVSQDGHRLYLGRTHPEAPSSPQPLEQCILNFWDETNRPKEVPVLVHAFAQSVAQQDRVRAVHLETELCDLFRPRDLGTWDKDGKGHMYAVLGQINLEQGWLAEANYEFYKVLAFVPPGEPKWGRSIARQMASYGLARSNALQGCYQEAGKWLARAPGEYNEGCGNANSAVADDNYPLKVVWTVANRPLLFAEPELREIMEGNFTPRHSDLNGDTSEAQRLHAAAEAGLTLGCLYEQAGRHADARACWSLVASNATAQHEASEFARLMLAQHP